MSEGKKKIFFIGRKKGQGNVTDSDVLTEGMVLRRDVYQQKENRIFTLLLKGLIVYLIVSGAMGCYLSALDVSYSPLFLQLTLFIASAFCALLYYNKRWQDVGYFILLLIMLFAGNSMRNYINSGFYSVANDLSEQASSYFDSNAVRSYGEQVGNRSLAVTVSMCYIGSVCCILVNILISRRMQYIMAVLLSVGMLAAPLYFDLEPSFLYIAMLFTGLMSSCILKRNGHYRLSEDDFSYQLTARKNRLDYRYSSKMMAELVGTLAAGALVLSGVLSLLVPKDFYQDIRGTSPVKASVKDTVENVSIMGLMGLFNFYPNTGGLTNGTLGGVSAVRLDFETDLTLTFAPYTENRIYFKTFTGNRYLPVTNRWERQTDEAGRSLGEQPEETADLLKERFEAGDKRSARGQINIKNVAAASGIYLPYYSNEVTDIVYPGQEQEYTFYPRVSEEALGLSEQSYTRVREQWMDIPEENIQVIQSFCKEAGLDPEDSIQTNASKLAAYYQENIPYTIRPGATPYRQDFINYFLTQNRRGYCAHFASAATLIMRYLGVPARYVEGYAIDPEDIGEEGTIEYDEKYGSYYEGYSPLGETAVVSVNATDANAHAWVEVYDEKLGWQVIEVTPASDEDEADNGLWSRILNFFRQNGNNGTGTDQEPDAENAGQDAVQGQVQGMVRLVLGLLSGFAAAVAAGLWGIKKVKDAWRYHRASWNDKLVMAYGRYISRISKKEEELRHQMNYQEQITWMSAHGYWRQEKISAEQAVKYLEQAGFSDRKLTEDEFGNVIECMSKA